jgi:hypothetical protein
LSDRIVKLAMYVGMGVVLYFAFQWSIAPLLEPKPGVDTVYTFVDREAMARAETTRVTVTKYRDRIDSIIRLDTLNQRDTVFLRSIDTLLIECGKCATQIDSLRKVIRNLRDTIAKRDGTIARCRKTKPWYAAGGVVVGAALACHD